MRRDERVDLERALALKIYWSRADGVAARREWSRVTGKSDRAYYRRLAEAKKDSDRLAMEYPDLGEAYHRGGRGRHLTWTDEGCDQECIF